MNYALGQEKKARKDEEAQAEEEKKENAAQETVAAMEKELRDARISVLLHTGAAIAVSFLSIRLGNNLLAGVVGIAILLGLGYGFERLAGKKGLKWWLANGVVLYLFFWLVAWAYLFNSGF